MPLVRFVNVTGDVHGSNGVSTGSRTGSKRHAYVDPGWSKKLSVASALVLVPPGSTGPVMTVAGGATTFHV